MDNRQPFIANNIVFCEKPWKLAASIFGILVTLTFLWAAYILTHFLGEYRYEDYSINAFDGGMAGIINVALTDPARLQSLVAPAVTTVTDKQHRQVASGIIVHPEGYVLTTAHSIQGLTTLLVQVRGQQGLKSYPVEVIKIHPQHDLAMLKMVTNDKFLFVKLTDTLTLKAGVPTFAFGNGAQGTFVTRTGPLKQRGLNLQVGNQNITHLFQANVNFAPELDGGPLIDSQAKLIGINIVIRQPSGQLEGYTVPAHVIQAHFTDVVKLVPPPPAPSRTDLVAPPEPQVTLGSMAANWWQQARVQHDPRNLQPTPSGMAAAAQLPTQVNPLLQGTTPPPGLDHIGLPGDKVTLLDLSKDTAFQIGHFQLDAMFGLALLGLASGLVGNLMPMGGSIVIIVGMMSFFGYGLYLIRPVIYIANLFTYGLIAKQFLTQGLVMRARIRPLIPWIIFGVVTGFFIGHLLSDHVVGYLLALFALLLGAVALHDLMVPHHDVPPIQQPAPRNRGEILEEFLNRSGLVLFARQQSPLNAQPDSMTSIALMGAPLGLLTGVLGISGGITEAYYQRRIAGISAANALANTAVMVFVASVTAALVSFAYGAMVGAFSWQTPLTLAMILVPCIYAGALIGAKFTVNIPIKNLRMGFIMTMLGIAAVQVMAQW